MAHGLHSIPNYRPKELSLTWFLDATSRYLRVDGGMKNWLKLPAGVLKLIEYREIRNDPKNGGLSPGMQVALSTLTKLKDAMAALELYHATVKVYHAAKKVLKGDFSTLAPAVIELPCPLKDVMNFLTSDQDTKKFFYKIDATTENLVNLIGDKGGIVPYQIERVTPELREKVWLAFCASIVIFPQMQEYMEIAAGLQLMTGWDRIWASKNLIDRDKALLNKGVYNVTNLSVDLTADQKSALQAQITNKRFSMIKDFSYSALGFFMIVQVGANRFQVKDFVPKIAFTACSFTGTVFSLLAHYHKEYYFDKN